MPMMRQVPPLSKPMSEKNKLSLSVQFADERLTDAITRPHIRRWVKAAQLASAELTIRFVNEQEGQLLNHDYRGKDYATNVLTFSYNESTDDTDDIVRADIVLCADVVLREAKEQHRSIEHHVAHLIVHGVLHAQGYDHESDEEAAEMENFETEILARLGIPDPYQ
jgi:probable rRNA maturation factor